jgi:hypothetical protein
MKLCTNNYVFDVLWLLIGFGLAEFELPQWHTNSVFGRVVSEAVIVVLQTCYTGRAKVPTPSSLPYFI